MVSKVYALDDQPSAAEVNGWLAAPQGADVATDEATTSGSYVDLATAGPQVTLSLAANQVVLVYVSCEYNNAAADIATGYISFNVTGASPTQNASDINGAKIFTNKQGVSSISGSVAGKWRIYTATTTGSHTFKCRYRSDGTVNMHFLNRSIIVLPKW